MFKLKSDNMKRLAAVLIFLSLVTGIGVILPQGTAMAATPYAPTITSAPVTAWYNESPYTYVIAASQSTLYALKTNSTLHLVSFNSTQAVVFGTENITGSLKSYCVS